MLAGLLQSTAAARLEIRGVKPDLVLLLLVLGTLIYGSRSGLVWAFVGGIALDIFSGGPMGASSLALMAAVLVAGLGHRTLSRYNLLVPLGAMHWARRPMAWSIWPFWVRLTCLRWRRVRCLVADDPVYRGAGCALQYDADVVVRSVPESCAGESGYLRLGECLSDRSLRRCWSELSGWID